MIVNNDSKQKNIRSLQTQTNATAAEATWQTGAIDQEQSNIDRAVNRVTLIARYNHDRMYRANHLSNHLQ